METPVQPDASTIEIIAHPTQADLNALEDAMKQPAGEFVVNPPLTDEQVEAWAQRAFTEPESLEDLNAVYSQPDIDRVNQRILEIEIEKRAAADAAAEDAEIAAEDESDGYALVDTVTYGEETKRIHVPGLQAKVEVEYDERAQRGVSAALDRYGDHGLVTLRIIADHNSRAALSRKDEDSVTHLKVHFHHQDA